jgi:hypothetical protein
MSEEDQPQSTSDKEKAKQVNEQVSINESITVKLERVEKLLKEAEERQKKVEVLESQRKEQEESLKEIKRKLKMNT